MALAPTSRTIYSWADVRFPVVHVDDLVFGDNIGAKRGPNSKDAQEKCQTSALSVRTSAQQ